ncbi:nitrate reductase [Sinimarinibacterium flocculans]|uniref:nitrate reductase n=1 Tax=Sinimarinibacterium flocculans TaxID=985250 RepID=UPI00351101D7
MSEAGRPVKTTCPYCGTGCGVDVLVRGDATEVSGDATHPTNAGKLCVKGAALGETLVPEGRALHPMLREPAGGRELQRVSWDTALDVVAREFRRIIREDGPQAVAWYVSGQLLTEDYYVANKLVKGFVGSANIDTNSRLCMSSAVAGHKRAFGEDIVPVSYEDLEDADLVVLVGSNTAWCHPILYQRIVKAKAARPQMKVVVVDPRRTATTDAADLHLPVRAGTDVWLFNGLLSFLYQHGVVDTDFVDAHTRGFDRALAVADNTAGSVRAVARQCGVDESLIAEFYRLFARTAKTITAFSMGVNQSSAGTDKVNSIINCHLLTGRIGKPGAGPFSITGQPNAMGGREVGGLANMLAAHMDLENAQHRQLVQTFWDSPCIAERPGLKAVELFEAIESGRVKAVWIMATNPVVSLPDADQVKRALAKCEFVVVSDVMHKTDTTAYAHVLLPALAWGEKDGTVTNSERRISRQRAFLPAPGEARPDWWALAEIGRRWGFADAFAYDGPGQIFDEHARLTTFGNADDEVPRYLNLSGLVGMSAGDYDALAPVRWPVSGQDGNDPRPDAAAADAFMPRVFSDGRFYTADRKARFVATPPRLPVHARDEDFPLALNTGRVRDHWHTMTRTGLSPRLAAHIDEPYVDLHPQDALLSGVREGGLARVSTRWGSLVARVRTSGELPRRTAFVPIHWNAQYASDARVGSLVNPVVDPVSGEPEFKHTPARVEDFAVLWHGFVLSRTPLPMDQVIWWTRVTGHRFLRYEFAGRERVGEWSAFARTALGVHATDADWIEYEDRTAGQYRAAWVVDDRIEACLFVSPRPDLPSRAWLSGLFAKDRLEDLDRIGLLVGEPTDRGADAGPTVCSCFGIGRNRIVEAVRGGCHSAEALGRKLQCGTNCGSCIPELKALIATSLVPA